MLLGYQGGSEVLNELGEPVQTPLHVSPDPRTDAESQFQFDADGNLTLGDELRWMVDFDEAVRAAWASASTLTPQQAPGLRPPVRARRAPERRCRERREPTCRTSSSITISASPDSRCCRRARPPTTPKRATRPTRARTIPTRASTSSSRTRRASTETDDWLDKRDGQWLAEALGPRHRVAEADPERRRGRSIRSARDEHGAVARDARLLHGHAAQARVRRRCAVLHALVLQPLRQRPRRRCRPFASGGSRTASCRRRRSAAMRWTRWRQSHVPQFAFATKFSSNVRARSRTGCGSTRRSSTRCALRWAQLAQGVAHVDSHGRRSAPDAARHRGPASRRPSSSTSATRTRRTRSTTSPRCGSSSSPGRRCRRTSCTTRPSRC